MRQARFAAAGVRYTRSAPLQIDENQRIRVWIEPVHGSAPPEI
jgi:hypothetical protein